MILFGGGSPQDNRVKTGQVKDWVRECFGLSDETVVMVTELRCSEPGCPPVETIVAVLDGPGLKRQQKLHKCVAELTREDIAALEL